MDFSNISIYSDCINPLLEALLPYIAPIIAAAIFWKIIKIILHKLYSFINIGLTARETKRAYKKIDNVVDGVSTISDLASSLKSDKGK